MIAPFGMEPSRRPRSYLTLSDTQNNMQALVDRKYQHGFVTEIDADTVAPGLNEGVIRLISAKKMNRSFCYPGGFPPTGTG